MMPPAHGKTLFVEIAELIGQDGADKLFEKYKGERLYIIDLTKTREATGLRNERIRQLYHKGTDLETLAKTYKMTTRWIREIVREYRRQSGSNSAEWISRL